MVTGEATAPTALQTHIISHKQKIEDENTYEGLDAAGEAAAGEEAGEEPDDPDEPDEPAEPDEPEEADVVGLEDEETTAGVPPTVASWKRLGCAPSGKSYLSLYVGAS